MGPRVRACAAESAGRCTPDLITSASIEPPDYPKASSLGVSKGRAVQPTHRPAFEWGEGPAMQLRAGSQVQLPAWVQLSTRPAKQRPVKPVQPRLKRAVTPRLGWQNFLDGQVRRDCCSFFAFFFALFFLADVCLAHAAPAMRMPAAAWSCLPAGQTTHVLMLLVTEVGRRTPSCVVPVQGVPNTLSPVIHSINHHPARRPRTPVRGHHRGSDELLSSEQHQGILLPAWTAG